MADTLDAPMNLSGRYALFGGETHYAAGGWNDFKGAFPTAEIATEAGTSAMTPERRYGQDWSVEWWHVVDLATGEIVAESEATAVS
jgi:hypothetical protein